MNVRYTHVCVLKWKWQGGGSGYQSPQGVVAGGIHRSLSLSLSSFWVIILVLSRQEWDRQCWPSDEAPWPLEIHFHPAFISFPFSGSRQTALTPVHTQRLITAPWSILKNHLYPPITKKHQMWKTAKRGVLLFSSRWSINVDKNVGDATTKLKMTQISKRYFLLCHNWFLL